MGKDGHDVDVYMMTRQTSFDMNVVSQHDFVQSEKKKSLAVKEVQLHHGENPTQTVRLGLVDMTKASFARGSDLFGDLSL